MNPNKAPKSQDDPRTTMKVHRSTLFKIQELRGRFGYTSGEKMLIAAMKLLERTGATE